MQVLSSPTPVVSSHRGSTESDPLAKGHSCQAGSSPEHSGIRLAGGSPFDMAV